MRNGEGGSRDKPSSLRIKRTPHLPRTVVNEGCFATKIYEPLTIISPGPWPVQSNDPTGRWAVISQYQTAPAP